MRTCRRVHLDELCKCNMCEMGEGSDLQIAFIANRRTLTNTLESPRGLLPIRSMIDRPLVSKSFNETERYGLCLDHQLSLAES